ncbi:MAG: ATP phosphoribosyltransferase regulatory subunit [Butyrivibrio sp.]|nr:ATP phosphoribosyltransferase regulatory subunit [Butyrivibrio sp.]
MERKLLHTPEGVRDIYNGECEERLLIQDRLRSVLKLYGYKDIQTPSFEFFDIFNKERGSVASKNMFKFFDREGNTLVLRPDMTPAIARCAAKYFENEKETVRLCYIGNSFINNSRYQGRLKETTQAGCELIGNNSADADAEVIALLIDSILSSGLTEFQVEVGHIGFFSGLVKEAGISEAGEAELREIIRNKNIFRVGEILESEGVSDESGESFYRLAQLFGNVEILKEAEALTKNTAALAAIEHLREVYGLLKVYGFERYVTFDLGMLNEHNYYTGVIFRAYTHKVGEPLAGGGRYDKLIGQFGKERPSIGFTLTVDLLHQAVQRQHIELPKADAVKTVVYGGGQAADAVRLASFFRNSGISARLLPAEQADGKASENVIWADAAALERYGIKQ